jgi:hypothetical protein
MATAALKKKRVPFWTNQKGGTKMRIQSSTWTKRNEKGTAAMGSTSTPKKLNQTKNQ